MKRLLALLTALMLLLSLAACGSGNNPVSENQGGKEPALTGDKDLDEVLDDLDEALDLLEYLKAEGWDENNYGAYIYDVWDEAQLPDCLPGPVDGIKVDQTFYKDYKHDTLQEDYSVGAINYETYEDYREYGVRFYATMDQLEQYITALKGNGFSGGTGNDPDDTWLEYHFSNSDGWYVYIFFNTNDDEDGTYDGAATVYATDSVWDYPDSVAGTSLPKVGAPVYDYTGEFWVETYNYEIEDMDGIEYDLNSDSFPDSETQSWWMWFAYYGVSREQAKAYAQQLVAEGWTLQWETDGEDDYWSSLLKDDVYAVVNCYNGLELEVGFSDMAENLSY